MQIFQRDRLPEPGVFEDYRKRVLTKATYIEGPFRVVTREGVMEATNAWLAIDAYGWPYPIASDVFEKAYELAESPLYE